MPESAVLDFYFLFSNKNETLSISINNFEKKI